MRTATTMLSLLLLQTILALSLLVQRRQVTALSLRPPACTTGGAAGSGGAVISSIRHCRRTSGGVTSDLRMHERLEQQLKEGNDEEEEDAPRMQKSSGATATATRRRILDGILRGAASGALLTSRPAAASAAAQRAIGVGEARCREAGNCLEVGEWDGAVGWNWGGADRCDPADPRCGPDGKLRAEGDEIVGKPVPEPLADITAVVAIQIDIGRAESGVLRLGLYGKDCPGSVSQLMDFCSSNGLSTVGADQNSLGAVTRPVSLLSGGVVDAISPGSTVDFGVPSQSNAYGRSRGLSRVDSFVPQPKPKPSAVAGDGTVRSHDAAGLVSVSQKGLGYGGTGFEQDDETFESSFLITASSVPTLDKNRRVVGQVLDAQSMALLERLSTLPTRKGIKGIIPGQSTGPPLLKVVVRDAAVSNVVKKE